MLILAHMQICFHENTDTLDHIFTENESDVVLIIGGLF